jgi:DNA-binding CsgD family transcriptional regulator
MGQSGRTTDPPRRPLAPDPTRRRLSTREREVALLVADGVDDPTLAQRLGLSPKTVANYITRIRLRLVLESREDLARWVNARRGPDHLGTRLRRLEIDTTA